MKRILLFAALLLTFSTQALCVTGGMMGPGNYYVKYSKNPDKEKWHIVEYGEDIVPNREGTNSFTTGGYKKFGSKDGCITALGFMEEGTRYIIELGKFHCPNAR